MLNRILSNRRLRELFAACDLLLFVRFIGWVWSSIPSFSNELPVWAVLIEYVRLSLTLSFLASGVGLLLHRSWAHLLVLIQFPFRLFSLLLSFGFLTMLAKPFDSPSVYQALLVFAILLELIRFLLTWRAWRGITKASN